LDPGLAGLDALGGLELDGDDGAGIEERLEREPTADDSGHDRDDPDRLQRARARLARDGLRHMARFARLAHGRASCAAGSSVASASLGGPSSAASQVMRGSKLLEAS